MQSHVDDAGTADGAGDGAEVGVGDDGAGASSGLLRQDVELAANRADGAGGGSGDLAVIRRTAYVSLTDIRLVLWNVEAGGVGEVEYVEFVLG